MKFRILGLTLAAASALSPGLSQAWTGKASLNACVNAFEKSLDSSAGREFKVIFSGGRFEDNSLAAVFMPAEYTFDLAANDPKTGKVYARARCLADSRGTVSSLSPLPLGDEANTRTAALTRILR
jgi:hypothetical protein